MARFAIGYTVVEDQRDHDFEHFAQQGYKFAARGLTAGQLGANALRDRRDTGLHLLAELLDDGAVKAFLTAEVILDGRKIDAGLVSDGAGAGAFEAAGGEQLERGLQDAAAGLLTTLLRAWSEAVDSDRHRVRPGLKGRRDKPIN